MSRKSHYSTEDKIRTVKSFIEGKISFKEITKQLGRGDRKTFNYWDALYRYHGTSGLTPKSYNSSYSREMKYTIIKRYLSGESMDRIHQTIQNYKVCVIIIENQWRSIICLEEHVVISQKNLKSKWLNYTIVEKTIRYYSRI